MQTRQRAAQLRGSESRATNSPTPRASAGREASASRTSSRPLSLNGPTSAPSDKSKTGSLVDDPIPRRGAPPAIFPLSIASIPTRRSHGSDDESGDEHAVSSPLRASQESAADGTRRRLMAHVLPKLSRAADELMTLLENSDHVALEIETDVFHRYFQEYHHGTNASMFVDWLPLQDLDASAASVLAKANLVNTLDCIQRVKGGDSHTFRFLQELDASFPALFCPPGRHQRHLDLALDIRTCYLIESLARRANKADPRKIIASVFCEPTDEANYAYILSNGPFRTLGGWPDDENQTWLEEVSNRVTGVFTFVWKDRKTSGVARLREAFPLTRLLGDVRKWILGQYHDMQKPLRPEPEASPDQVEEEDHHESGSSIFQEIVRGNGPDKRESLFKNRESLKQLEATARRPAVPPSNQQQATASLNAPRVYNLSSADLLRMPTSPVAAARAPRSGLKMSRADAQGEDFNWDDDDDEDPFETDTRPPRDARKAAFPSSLPATKRVRIADNAAGEPTSSARTLASRLSAARAAPSSSAPAASAQVGFEAWGRRRASSEARRDHLRQPAWQKQRRPWSQADEDTLIALIAECNASWAVMEKHHGERFEHPRNQQAYRDKARNVKVDLLMRDAPLPPCFDNVILGPKEVDRVMRAGKNPNRYELDINEDGTVTNTEFRG